MLDSDPGIGEQVVKACRPGQRWVENSAVIFVWTAIPYRTEWRYAAIAPKLIAQDSGHICQNLYLASEAIGAGTCAISAYSQPLMDAALGVDGIEEFAVYIAPVGKIE
jgi:SagB-type dehydrogenase family enzyme